MLDLVLAAPDAGPTGVSARLVNTWSDDAGRAFARAYCDGRRRWIDWPGLGAFEFSPDSPIVVLYAATVDRARARDTFARIVQPIILQARGAETLHASAVTGPAGAIAFAAVSGHGKSTLAWALGQRDGFIQVADDAVVLDGLDDEVHIAPLPYVARLRPTAVSALAADAASLPTHDPSGAARRPLAAIVLLEQAIDADIAARPTPLPAPEAFTAVLTHAYCFDETDRIERERLVRHYLHVAARVPVFRLRYRPDFAALPNLVDAVIAATDRRTDGRVDA